mgnify:CR=1 FL=1
MPKASRSAQESTTEKERVKQTSQYLLNIHFLMELTMRIYIIIYDEAIFKLIKDNMDQKNRIG